VGKFVGDCMVTTKENLRKAKENKSVYTGRIKKNWIVEIFGKRFKVEELFKDTKQEDC